MTDRPTSRPPMTKEQIEAHSIGEITPLTEPIVLAGYDPQWPELSVRVVDTIERGPYRPRHAHELPLLLSTPGMTDPGT